MKRLLILPFLLSACAAPSGTSSNSGNEREDMERKLIAFQEKFDRFDDNGDGFLTRSEVSAGLINEQVEGITTAEVPKIFAFYDTNRDNRISLRETNAGYESGPDAALRAQGH